MKIFGFDLSTQTKPTWSDMARQAMTTIQEDQPIPKEASQRIQYFPVYNRGFDGEKTPGELGVAAEYEPEYSKLSLRSWEACLKSDIAQILINGDIDWVVGSGLKLQSEPMDKIITEEGFNLNKAEFTSKIESRFMMYSKNRTCDYSKRRTLAGLSRIARKHAKIGGDVLCVIRTDANGPNIQLIDGYDIQTPIAGGLLDESARRGNEIVHGVEVTKSGEHVAYYVVKKDGFTHTRIPAYGPRTKRRQAFLIYGSEYRVDDVRGLPQLSAVLEKIKKLDRYTEATVGGAEERAKIPIFVEHGINSDGQNPFINLIKQSQNAGEGNEPQNPYGTIEDTSKKVAMTTSKTLINMPLGATLKSIESRQETNFGEFLDKNFVYIAASLRMPVEIALMLFQNNFSSSRMAAKMWEQIVDIERYMFAESFYKPFFNIFLETQILTDKVQADGYFTALQSNDVIFLESYQNCRFVGPKVPHVDPLKEVNAEIKKIENQLTTREMSTENLGGGEFSSNQDKLREEEKIRFKPDTGEDSNVSE